MAEQLHLGTVSIRAARHHLVGRRTTLLLQSSCATISTVTPLLDVGIDFGRKNPVPDAGVRAVLVGIVRFGVKPPG